MAQVLNPYITFPGTCSEAMDFYAEALGGTVAKSTFRDFGMDTDGIMHASVQTPSGFHLFASDTAPGMGMTFTPGNNLQISLSGDDGAALRGYWDALSAGGQVLMPLERQGWGDDYGMLVDKFGIYWHVNIVVTPAAEG
jgi:PhnB protein